MNDPSTSWTAHLRDDGKKGIRNLLVVVYTVECAKFVAHAISQNEKDVHVIGFTGCYDNAYAIRLMMSLCRHPNVGGVLAVGLGCEYTQPSKIAESVRKSGRPAEHFFIQDSGGTTQSVAHGKNCLSKLRLEMESKQRLTTMTLKDLVIGCECGGSDGTSGLVGNPVVGKLFDRLVEQGGTAIFEEIVEMIGLEPILLKRAANSEVRHELSLVYQKAETYCKAVRQYSASPGNFAGGLTTIEEKSLGAFSKSGTSPIQGVIKVAQPPAHPGLWILDSVPDANYMQFGYTNPNDTEGIMDLISAGCHIVLFVTGRGSVIGSPISPLIKITGNPVTFAKLSEDMDFNAGAVLHGEMTLEESATELLDLIVKTASGSPSKPELLSHREYLIMYKYQDHPGKQRRCEE